MSLQKVLFELRKDDIQFLKLFFREYTYDKDTTLFYKDQTPSLAYLLTEGLIKLKKNRTTLNVPLANIIGVRELFGKEPASFQATILSGSKVISLDLFTFHQFLKDNPNYYEIFKLEIL